MTYFLKILRLRIKSAWAVLISESYMVIVRNGEDVSLSREMADQDAVRYLIAWANIITGGQKAIDEATEILKNKRAE